MDTLTLESAISTVNLYNDGLMVMPRRETWVGCFSFCLPLAPSLPSLISRSSLLHLTLYPPSHFLLNTTIITTNSQAVFVFPSSVRSYWMYWFTSKWWTWADSCSS